MAIIEDGTGDGKSARVDNNKQLHTFGINETEEQQAVDLGNGYNINTGVIGLTSSTESAILYIKNNEDQDLVISALAVGVGSAGTTTDVATVTVIRNPTTGTIIESTPTNVDMNKNRNFGSNKTLTIDAYKGSEGETFTDGDDIAILFNNQGSRLFATLNFELSKGNSIGVKIDTNTSSGTTNVYAAAVCYLKSTDNA